MRETLGLMDPVDFWGRADRPFYGGPVGMHATLHLLAELGLPRIPQIEAACENLFAYGQHTNGGFTCDGTAGQIMLCHTDNAIRTLTHFGYLGDPRLERVRLPGRPQRRPWRPDLPLQVEEQGRPGKWITFRALRTNKHTHQAIHRAERAGPKPCRG